MGKGGAKTKVSKYFLSQHMGVCLQADTLLAITVKEKLAWSGEVTTQSSFILDKDTLFGGKEKEGGVEGVVYWLPGADDQVMPDLLAQKLGRANGADCPAYRGMASIFFVGPAGTPYASSSTWSKRTRGKKGFYWSANSPYLPGVWVKVGRAPAGLTQITEFGPDLPFSVSVNLPDPLPTDHPFGFGFELSWDFTFFARNGAGAQSQFLGYGNWRSDGSINDASGSWLGSNGVTLYWTATYTGQLELTFTSSEPLELRNLGGLIDNRIYVSYQSGTAFDYSTLSLVATNDHGNPVTISNFSPYFGGGGGLNGATFDIGTYQFHADGGGGEVPTPMIGLDANPAAIIYECLTNTDWGMGSPATAIDADSFRAAATALDNEEFGLSMIWTQQSSIQDFIQEVLDHIQAVLFVDPQSGLLTLKLVRADYDEATLPELTPSNSYIESFGRTLWGEISNEIVVTWTNPETEEEETVTAQDNASIVTQGGIISDSRNYYGVRNANLARKLAARDLRASGAPLATCQVEVDRTFWALRPASVVKVTSPEHGLDGLVMRVMEIKYGAKRIQLDLLEDVFGLDAGDYTAPPGSGWVDPSEAPAPLTIERVFTLPLFFANNVPDVPDNPVYPEVLAGVLGTTTQADAYDIDLWDEVTLSNGDLEWDEIGTLNVIGHGVLDAALAAEATSTGVAFTSLIGNTTPEVAGFVLIGDGAEDENEIAQIDADGASYTLRRGVLDTVPRAWPAGTPVWFVDDSTLFEDSTIRAAGEVADYKLLPRTSLGTLALADAALVSATLTERPWLPNRPANVQVDGVLFNTAVTPVDMTARADPWVTISWANRNRLSEDSQVLGWTDATVTPEDGQTTRIEVLAIDGTTVLATHDGLSGTSFDVPDASFGTEAVVLLRAWADRSDADGDFASLQAHGIWVQVAADSFITEGGDGVITEGGDRLIFEG